MRMFRFWSREKCVDAINALEEAIALGAKTTSFQGQVVSWNSLEEATSILSQLYARVDTLDGKSRSGLGEISFIRVVPRRGL